jgi:hypothetical protein
MYLPERVTPLSAGAVIWRREWNHTRVLCDSFLAGSEDGYRHRRLLTVSHSDVLALLREIRSVPHEEE